MLAFLALALDAAAVSAQDAPPPPRIRISTRLVQVDVIARDKSGPVADLTKDDFSLLDRGKSQEISLFSVESGSSEKHLVQPLLPNTFSDLPRYGASTPRSLTIVLLDNLNTLSGSAPEPYETTPFWLEDHALANARQHLIEFLKQADARDRIAIYGLTQSLHVLCDFTCNREQLLAVVGNYDVTSHTQRDTAEPGNFHIPNTPNLFNGLLDESAQGLAALNNQARAQTTMAALSVIADHVADVPARKNLLWLTANLPFSGRAIARILSRANIAAYPVDARGLLPRAPQGNLEGVVDEDAFALGALGGPPAMSAEPIGIGTMQDMAEDTGGRAFVNTNDLTGAIREAIEDSVATYTLGFYIDNDSIDGKFHEIKLEVKRKGVILHYPRGYFAFRDLPVTKEESRSSLIAALHSPIESSAIPVQVKIDRVEKPLPHCLSIFGSIDIHNIQNGGVREAALDVVTVEQDQSGKVVAQSGKRINLHSSDKTYADYVKSGVPFHQYVQPKADATTLRILVEDPTTAEVGSLMIPLSDIK
ncbi:MAG: VWA domain-containing protein [Candidatus Sulfotelmatobacter sp.]